MSRQLNELIDELIAFREERNWNQFHTLKNLASALSIEASELLELTLWKDDQQLGHDIADDEFRSKLSNEIADVFMYLLMICEHSGIDPVEAARDKIVINEGRYPPDKSRGNAIKYTELE